MKKIKRTAICAAVFLLACHNGSVSGCVTAQAGIKVVQMTSDGKYGTAGIMERWRTEFL